MISIFIVEKKLEYIENTKSEVFIVFSQFTDLNQIKKFMKNFRYALLVSVSRYGSISD